MAWKKSTLKHSQTFSCAKFDFMDMLLMAGSRRSFAPCQGAGVSLQLILRNKKARQILAGLCFVATLKHCWRAFMPTIALIEFLRCCLSLKPNGLFVLNKFQDMGLASAISAFF
jgi:hypothetical protein